MQRDEVGEERQWPASELVFLRKSLGFILKTI